MNVILEYIAGGCMMLSVLLWVVFLLVLTAALVFLRSSDPACVRLIRQTETGLLILAIAGGLSATLGVFGTVALTIFY